MSFPNLQPGRNGHGPDHDKAPSLNGGAFPVPDTLEAPAAVVRAKRKRTIFPPNAAADSFSSFLYQAYRHELGALPLTRWVILALFGIAVALLPLRAWWLSAAIVVASLVLILCVVIWRRRDFVRFTEQSLPNVAPKVLDPAEKVPIHVTGHLSVEGQYARYTALPGFYRSFATREHALLCLVRPSRFLRVAIWPPEQTGMWYAFFSPQLMHSVRYGSLHFNRQASPAVAVTYDFSYVKPSREKEQILRETVFIACRDERDAQRILADLRKEVPISREPASSSAAA
jgi:hypothetical protein